MLRQPRLQAANTWPRADGLAGGGARPAFAAPQTVAIARDAPQQWSEERRRRQVPSYPDDPDTPVLAQLLQGPCRALHCS